MHKRVEENGSPKCEHEISVSGNIDGMEQEIRVGLDG